MKHRFIGKPKVKVVFEKRDLWVGLYWQQSVYPEILRLYICIVPLLPIVVSIPFRAKIWPYYFDGKWYPKGDAPMGYAKVESVD